MGIGVGVEGAGVAVAVLTSVATEVGAALSARAFTSEDGSSSTQPTRNAPAAAAMLPPAAPRNLRRVYLDRLGLGDGGLVLDMLALDMVDSRPAGA